MKFEDVETARKAYSDKFKKYLFSSLLVAAAICLIAFFMQPILAIPLFLFIVAAIFIIIAIATNKYRTTYKKAYKGYFIEQNLNKIFSNLTYDHEKGFSPDVIRESGMIILADKFYSNDLTIAKYQKIAFAQADVGIIQVTTDDKGNSYETPIFKGRYIVFQFPKKFNYRLEVVGKKFRAAKVSGEQMNKLETESTDFNRYFKVYGEDGFESFYLLDPAVIAKIEDLGAHYKYKLLLGFYDNKLIVALDDGKDSFEPPSFMKPIDEKTEMEKVKTDIKVITDFVDIISSH